ncbi:hypothetical protein ACMDCR_25950 [Labrys okinawensis]|uniref:hypothetical protein n=1 Tax=Labrys okinawensis TaxID=346911 RepID=UPI0039BD6C7C
MKDIVMKFMPQIRGKHRIDLGERVGRRERETIVCLSANPLSAECESVNFLL